MKKVYIIAFAIVLAISTTMSVVYLNTAEPHRDLSYGAYLLPTDSEAGYAITVYDLSGSIKTKDLSADVTLTEPIKSLDSSLSLEFIKEYQKMGNKLEMLRTNWWLKLGSFKYDLVLQIDNEISKSQDVFFVNTDKKIMYTLCKISDGVFRFGRISLSDAQLDMLS